MKNSVSSIKKNFIYNSLYQLLTIIIPLVTTPYISRVLGSAGVGRYAYGYAIAYYFVIFAMLGVNNYGNRTIAAVSDSKEKLSKQFWSIYLFQFIVSTIVIAVYIVYVVFMRENDPIGWIMLIYVVSAAFDINWFFFGIEQFKVTVARNSVVKLITVACIFIFVRDSEDVYIYAFVSVIGMLLAQGILWFMLKKHIQFVRVKRSDILPHIKPNLLLFVPVIAISLYKFMDKIMLGLMCTNVEVGYYESCEKIVQLPIALATALGTVMLPRITNMLANEQNEESKKYLKKSIILVMLITAPMCFGIMAIAKEFVPVFYGNGYEKCADIFQVLLPSCLFLGIANVVRTQYLIPNQNDYIYIISVFSGAIVNFVLNALLIPTYQSIGAAIGTLFAEATVCVIQCFSIRKHVNIARYIVSSMPFLIGSIIMYAIVRNLELSTYSNFIGLLLKVVIGVFIYGIVVAVVFFRSKTRGIGNSHLL